MKLRTILLLASVATFQSGCIQYTSLAHRNSGETEVMTMTKTQRGYSLGPCGIVPGSSYIAGVVRLNGRRDSYSDGEYEVRFPNDPFPPQVSGTVSVNWKSHEVRIDLQEWRTQTGTPPSKLPSRLNGVFSFEEKEPNQPPEPTR